MFPRMAKSLSFVRLVGVLCCSLFLAANVRAQAPAVAVSAASFTYSDSGGEVTISANFSYVTASALGLSLVIPSGWTFGSVSGPDLPALGPAAGDRGEIGFAYTSIPNGSASFSFSLNYPAGLSGPQTLTGIVGRIVPVSSGLSCPDIVFAVAELPIINRQPSAATVAVGGSAVLSVVAEGKSPLSYQWKKDGINISGATSGTHTLATAQTSDAGSYTVQVSNSLGSVVSSAALLTVNLVAPVSVVVESNVPNYSGEGGTARINVSIRHTGAGAIGLALRLPSAWTFQSASGTNVPQVLPLQGDLGQLSFAYTDLSVNSLSFSFLVNYPAGLVGDQVVTGIVGSILPRSPAISRPDLHFFSR